MDLIVWLLPIVFMFHDFEEIIFMKPWANRNRGYIDKRFPKLAKVALSQVDGLSTSSFALIVAEEFILISVVTVIAYNTKTYYLWFAIFMAFFIHLIMHIGQWILFRRYVPTIVTSLLASVYCVYAYREVMSYNLFTTEEVIQWSIIGLVIIVVNVAAGHYFARHFENWLRKFEKGQ